MSAICRHDRPETARRDNLLPRPALPHTAECHRSTEFGTNARLELGAQGAACAIFMACGMGGAALAGETLLIHGHIYTGNAREPWAAALAVKDAASRRWVPMRRSSSTVPHTPASSICTDERLFPASSTRTCTCSTARMRCTGLNLSTPASSVTPDQPDLLVERLRSYAAAHPRDAVVLGRADFSTVPPTTPTHALLDRAVPYRPW